MKVGRCLATALCAALLAPAARAASPLVTGNGFGFAVVSPESAAVTKFYAHPYRFTRPDPQKPLGEGVETANFVKYLTWGKTAPQDISGEYVEESQVIRLCSSTGQGLFFMPFGLQQAALILSWEPSTSTARNQSLGVEWSRPVSSRRAFRIVGNDVQVLKFDGIEESLLLIPLDRKQTRRARGDLKGSLSWALISVEANGGVEQTVREFLRWRAGLAPRALAGREIAEVERWRVKPTVNFSGEQQRRVWRQSEVVLRMGQSREPNRPGRYNHGLIVAALPDGLWCTPWVRDMAYATVALARMGHRDEARAALLAYFEARPTGKMRAQTRGADYQVSVVRYFGDGSEEPFFTMEGSTNIEFDGWGLVLWALGEYLHKYDDSALLRTRTWRGPLYESARDYIAKPLIANLEEYDSGLIASSDTSIWEERQKDAKHFAFTSAAAIAGLRSFAETAKRARDDSTRKEIIKQLERLQKGFAAAFVRGHLRGTLEEGVKNDMDGALLAAINLGVVTDSALLRDTVERMELLKVRSGGYRRVRSVFTDPSIFEYWYERQEFVFVDLSLVGVLRRLERNDEASAMLARIVQKAAADYNLIPEMYVSESCELFPGEVGAPTGARPMVGYGAGAYVLEVMHQADS